MPYWIGVRTLAACSSTLLLGMPVALWGQTPNECLPNPLVPGSCLGIETVVPGIRIEPHFLPTPRKAVTGNHDTDRPRVAPRQGQPSADNKPARVNAPSTPLRSTSGGGATGAAVNAGSGRPAASGTAVNGLLGNGASPLSTSSGLTTSPARNQSAEDSDVAKRVNERARRQARTPD